MLVAKLCTRTPERAEMRESTHTYSDGSQRVYTTIRCPSCKQRGRITRSLYQGRLVLDCSCGMMTFIQQ